MVFFVPHSFNFAERLSILMIPTDYTFRSSIATDDAKPTKDTLESDEDDHRISKIFYGTAELPPNHRTC